MFGLKKWFLGGMLIVAITSLPLFAAHAMNKVYFESATFEQSEGGPATITIKRDVGVTTLLDDVSKTVTVDFTTSAGTAIADLDYIEVTETVTFPALSSEIFSSCSFSVPCILAAFEAVSSQTVTITIINDDYYYEEDETVNLTLSNPTEASLETYSIATLTIKEDETAATCGNSVVEFTEACDNGTDVDGDCCNDLTCQFDPIDTSCDDHNTCSPIETDQCNDVGVCVGSGSTCGNNILDDVECGEQCDDNNLVNGDGCSATCQIEFCGDGSINNDDAEQCDDGNTKDNDGCSPTCKIEICGDGVVNNKGNELCDDGNAAGGDGCSATCQVEFCGDGSVNNNGTEQCDDGNLTDGDGCDKNCAQEAAAEEAPAEEIPAGDASADASPAGGGCSLIRR